MGSFLNPYLVDYDELRAVPGSKDSKLLKEILTTCKGFLASVDDLPMESPLSCTQAVEQIINGDPVNEDWGFVYGYAYEAICKTIGSNLDPWPMSTKGSELFGQLDQALTSMSVALRFADLTGRGCLITIPKPVGFPFLGWWTAEEVAQAAPLLRKWARRKSDSELTRLLKDVRTWLEEALENEDDWVVGVYS
jgi:hypothetical protein